MGAVGLKNRVGSLAVGYGDFGNYGNNPSILDMVLQFLVVNLSNTIILESLLIVRG